MLKERRNSQCFLNSANILPSTIQVMKLEKTLTSSPILPWICFLGSVLSTISHASPCSLLPLHLLPIHGQQLIQFSEELRRCWAVIFLSQDESNALCGWRDCRSENTVVKHWLDNPEESVTSGSSSLSKIIGLLIYIFGGHLSCQGSLMFNLNQQRNQTLSLFLWSKVYLSSLSLSRTALQCCVVFDK